MSELKCPFCQQELQETFGIKQFWCSNYPKHTHPINLQGTKELWQELIRTRKALDVAVDALNAGKTLADIAGFKMLVAGLEKALEQITALKQKE